jgi:signal transduction histidine kinase
VRLEQLVAGVLEYSKISAQGEHTELVNLKSVLDEIRNHLAPQLAPIHATIKLDDSYPQVIGEHVWLYQVFSNRLGNAIKFRDPERSLNISVTQSPAPSGREVVVSVSDNGLGIPSDKVGNLFRPFQRAHSRSIEGTGIGLASVRRMLEKCGGSVRVESTEGIGSTFLVTLRTSR